MKKVITVMMFFSIIAALRELERGILPKGSTGWYVLYSALLAIAVIITATMSTKIFISAYDAWLLRRARKYERRKEIKLKIIASSQKYGFR